MSLIMATCTLHLNTAETGTYEVYGSKKRQLVRLAHLFAFHNFFELPPDPLGRDVRHGCVCGAAAVSKLHPGPLSLCCLCVDTDCWLGAVHGYEALLSLSLSAASFHFRQLTVAVSNLPVHNIQNNTHLHTQCS